MNKDESNRTHPASGSRAQSNGKSDVVRTAVVVVHGMGEQVPTETVNRFVMSALPKSPDWHKPPRGDPERRYFSRPEQVTDSYEARRLLAPAQPYPNKVRDDNPKIHDQFEFFEYHWSYKMQGNRLSDFVPTLRRLLMRWPAHVPYGLRGAWTIAWVIIVALAVLAGWFVASRSTEGQLTPSAFVVFLLTAVVAAPLAGLLSSIVLWVLKAAGNTVTAYFVDVVRYLDRSPRSYAARRDIRDGMVGLLRSIHERGTYQRVIVVAHSLGGYIAYDGITSLWYEYASAHHGPILPDNKAVPALAGRLELQRAGEALEKAAKPGNDASKRDLRRFRYPRPLDEVTPQVRERLDDYRRKQFALWKGLREQGSPWLITDFITFGTPMAFAELLYTKNRRQFDDLLHRAEMPKSPPLARSQTVEDEEEDGDVSYTYKSKGRWVLYHSAQFAVVRWTNIYFPAVGGFWGDWFGGPLRGLFGPGVLDIPVMGNNGHESKPRPDGASTFWRNRRTPAAAHGYYFSFPDEDSRLHESDEPRDVAPLLKKYLELTIADQLAPFVHVEPALAETFAAGRPASDTSGQLGRE